MVNLGVPSEDVHVDTMSLDTLGNAWWGISAIEVRGMPLHVAVVTSEFHVDRSMFAYEWAAEGKGIKVIEEAVPDVGMDEEGLAGRVKREAESLEMYKMKREVYPDLADYLFTEHGLYSGKGVVGRMGRGGERGCDKIDEPTRRSYGGSWDDGEQPRMWREAAMLAVGFLVGFLINVRKGRDKNKD